MIPKSITARCPHPMVVDHLQRISQKPVPRLWLDPVANACRKLPAEGVQDIRVLWRSNTPGSDRFERIEQRGNKTVVTTAGIIHDFYTDGTTRDGSRDLEPPICMNTRVAMAWQDGALNVRLFSGSVTVVTRYLEDDEPVWR